MKKNLLWSTLFVTSTLGLAACNGGNNHNPAPSSNSSVRALSQPETLKKYKLHNNLYSVQIGSGYNSISNLATSNQPCLAAAANQKNIYISNPTAQITLDQVQDLDSLQKNLGVNVEGDFGADRFSMSMSSDFVNGSINNNYTTNIVYLYKYAGKASFIPGSVGESDAALTPVAAGMVHTDQQRFKAMCGDQFVAQMDAGATLGVRLTLSFNSHSDQSKFQAKFNGNLGLANIASSIEQAATNSNVHVGFSLNAIQQGGEPQNLNDIFGKVDPNGSYPFLECGSVGGSNEAACKAMIGAIISYAETLKGQLSSSDGSIKLNNLYYTNPSSDSYSTIGVQIGAIDPNPATLQAMRDLTANYDKTMYDYIFATHYLTALRDFIDAPTKNNLTDAADRLRNQISVYLSPTYKVINCFRDMVSENCVQIKENVDSALARYPLNNMELLLLDYLENTSYSASLINYNGGTVDDPTSYPKIDGCILAPISAPNYARYALNCDGHWLRTEELKVVPNELKGWLNVSGLEFYSGEIDSHPMLIIYPDLGLNQDSMDPNFFYEDQILVKSESEPNRTSFTKNSDIGITKLYHNQA